MMANPLSDFPPGEISLLPTRNIVWGPGSIDSLERILRRCGATRALVLTTRSLVKQGSLLAALEEACGELRVATFGDISAHAPLDSIIAAEAQISGLNADAMISFGGGSVIDAAKAVAGRMLDAGQRPPVHVAVPTTLSGAELAHFYGVTEQDQQGGAFKRSFAREEVTPAAVVYDGRLTVATPETLWAGSGLKALDHAVEGLLCGERHPVVSALAELGVRRMVTGLGASLDPEAVDLRQRCQIAAWECYVAPGAVTLGLSHRIGHILGGTYGISHALTSGVTLGAVMRAMANTTPTALASIARALDTNSSLDFSQPSEHTPLSASALWGALVSSLGLPTCVDDLGIAESELPRIAHLVLSRYPQTVAQLGDDGPRRLNTLLREMWYPGEKKNRRTS
ncbi:iron-containing alcohol dehydrogenase [Streptomyces sp. NPDC006668]|uniref:iron-containing alcohol dehydrogenase n=1 Tax=Streptomyces sp. NPDC006668 TaxID=3156903 RepID=UPI0033EDEB75